MLALALLVVFLLQWFSAHCPRSGFSARTRAAPAPGRGSARKPAWVRREVIRLKAQLREAGTCRAIEAIFNRRHLRKTGMRISHTFVSGVIRAHRYEIGVLRRKLKNRRPPPVPRNLVWGMDLTGKTDTRAHLHSILGMIDHGTRAELGLIALPNKSSFTLLGHLFLAFGHYGQPRAVRTDNESVFTSGLFRLALFLLGIRHLRIDPHCPWQNGRIERFFGPLKQSLDQLCVDSLEALNHALVEFRFFYNHVRPHQNLGGATPAEAWAGVDPYVSEIKREYWFEAWDGLLRGYYLRR